MILLKNILVDLGQHYVCYYTIYCGIKYFNYIFVFKESLLIKCNLMENITIVTDQLSLKKEWVKPELLNEEVENTEGGYFQRNFEGVRYYHS